MSSRPREIAMKRRLEIKRLIDEIGLWNVTRQALADKYGISRQMIDKDLHALIRGAPADDLNEIQFNLKTGYVKALKEMQKIMATAKDDKDKARAAQVFGQIGKQFTEMLEDYGLKEKIAQRIEVDGQISTIEMVKAWLKPKKKESLISEHSSETSGTVLIEDKSSSTSVVQDSGCSRVGEDGEKH